MKTSKNLTNQLSAVTFDAATETAQVQSILEDIAATLLDMALINRQNKWPDLLVEMCIHDKVVAVHRCDPFKYLFALTSDQSGLLCGEKHSAIFKPLQCTHLCTNCGCHFAVAELQMSIDLANSSGGVRAVLPIETAESNYMVNVFVHQAKLHPEFQYDVSGLQMNAIMGGKVTSTQLIGTNLAPIWNETLSFRGQVLSMDERRMSMVNVPLLVLELAWTSHKQVRRPDGNIL